MSSDSTVKAFTHTGDWDSESQSHPALKWFEPVVRDIFDAHVWSTPYSELYTDDVHLLLPNGTEVHGGKAAWAAVAELFGPMTAQRTVPDHFVIIETDYGWDAHATGKIYGNLPGDSHPTEEKVSDGTKDGKDWDVKLIGAFRFQFVKEGGPKGILLKTVQIVADSSPIVMRMVQRGLIKPGDLGFI